MAKDPQAIIISGIGVVAGILIMYGGFKMFQRKRLVEDLPTSKVRSIAMGLVEVNGKAHAAEKKIITSPLSGKKCVYYKYTVEKYVSNGKSGHWRVMKKNSSFEPFYLQDNTGKVLVDPNKAEINVPKAYESKSQWGKDPEPIVRKFLKNENIRFEGALFGANHTMRYREWIVPPGMELYVLGDAGDNPYVENGTVEKGHDDIMIKRGKDHLMMISHGQEKQVLKSLKWKAFGGMIGGFLLSIVFLIGIILAITGG